MVSASSPASKDVVLVLTKKVLERIQNIAIIKQLQSYFKAKREKGVGKSFPRVPAPLHPCLRAHWEVKVCTLKLLTSDGKVWCFGCRKIGGPIAASTLELQLLRSEIPSGMWA